jgi:ATP-binding cassette subfamily B protein
VLVDGEPLDAARVHALRREVAWVDPAVHLWNRSLLDNLSYGAPGAARHHVAEALDAADLREVLERLPDGLQTRLGEGGALVSGGEGQRVRLGRAVIRPGVRLAILDEPFRGLGREQRRDLLARARKLWHHATLLCITHDVGETRSFPRVLVIEGGRLVEDGAPAELAARPGSRYRAMLEAEQALREGFWSDHRWRAVRIADGALDEEPRKEGLWRAI